MVFSLKRIVDWNHNYLVSSLGSFGNRIVAGDQISSVSLLKVTETGLVSQAKDYGPLYPVSVEALDSENIICANVSYSNWMYIVHCFWPKTCFRTVWTFAHSHWVRSWVVKHWNAMDFTIWEIWSPNSCEVEYEVSWGIKIKYRVFTNICLQRFSFNGSRWLGRDQTLARDCLLHFFGTDWCDHWCSRQRASDASHSIATELGCCGLKRWECESYKVIIKQKYCSSRTILSKLFDFE